MSQTLKRTPLFENHKHLGGKIVSFSGWELPVLYSGIIQEHQAVRTQAGVFDVSHMGEILVTGKEAQASISALTCNDLSSLYDGKGQYNAIINQNGGVVDDIIVYRMSAEKFFICVNAANTDKDFAWFQQHNTLQAKYENLSAQYGQIALQGPKAQVILERLCKEVKDLNYFHFIQNNLGIIARTGYTGEDGFEIFTPWNETAALWEKLLEVGKSAGLIPCGLGARDSLRLEACYPLHGHELADDITAIESGLSWIIKYDKGDFVGKNVLLEQKSKGASRSLVGFFVEDAGIAREGDVLCSEAGAEIGHVTSGTKTPTLNRALGLALVKNEYSKLDSVIFAKVRGKNLRCRVVKKPFYKKAV